MAETHIMACSKCGGSGREVTIVEIWWRVSRSLRNIGWSEAEIARAYEQLSATDMLWGMPRLNQIELLTSEGRMRTIPRGA
jgi:hypothetical protein